MPVCVSSTIMKGASSIPPLPRSWSGCRVGGARLSGVARHRGNDAAGNRFDGEQLAQVADDLDIAAP
jgi:hypothetical protein